MQTQISIDSAHINNPDALQIPHIEQEKKMIMTIPMELEEAKKEVGVDFFQIDDREFKSLKKKIFNNIGIIIEDNSNFIWEQFVENSSIYGEFAWEYIICYNHEMILSGCGKAKKWIEDLKIIKNIV